MEGVYTISPELKQQATEYRQSLYAQTPGVEQFIKIRRIALCTLMGLMVLHELINGVLMLQGFASIDYLFDNLIKFASYLILLALPFLGKWKMSLVLYLIAIPSMMGLAASWEAIELIRFTGMPLLFVLLATELLFAALVTLTALWLTVLPQSHRLGDSARQIYFDYTGFINERVTKQDTQ